MHSNRAMDTRRIGILGLWSIVAVLLVGAAAPPVWAQREVRRPRLVVLLVVDQLRADYLTRFRPDFGEGGFRRLMANGAHFANAHVSSGATYTAPGHATIITGRIPRQHGIVANEWVQGGADPALKAAFYDPDAKLLAGPAGATEGRSPRNLIGPALGDQLKLAALGARVFSVALKDRSAIALGGKRPDGVFWWDLNTGQFVTSNYYTKELPAYVQEFNRQRWADRFLGNKWDRALPPAAYALTYPLDPKWLANNAGLGSEFPHVLPRSEGKPGREFYTAVLSSPFGNDVTFELARRLLTAERLGANDTPDLLCLSLSSFDEAGHLFGPESPEMMDFAVRTDRQIAGFLDLLDRSVGLNRCLVVLASDHGVSTAPRLATALGLGGGRINLAAVIKVLNDRLSEIAALPGNRDYVTAASLPWLFLDPAVNNLEAQVRTQVLATARQTLRAVDGVADVFVGTELNGSAPAAPDMLHRRLAWRAYSPGRAGDIYLHLAPYWGVKGGNFAEHGTGYNQDRHVPIIIMGGGVLPGRYLGGADPADIAVTVAAMLGIEPPPDAVGRVLSEALDPAEGQR